MKIEESIRPKVENILSQDRKNMGHALGITFELLSRSEMRASMPVDENTTQPFGILHGGASVALAETLSSIGAYLNLRDDSMMAVGLEINANHIRPVRNGDQVIGTSKPVHRGAKTQVWETRIETQDGKLVCISRCTLAVVRKR